MIHKISHIVFLVCISLGVNSQSVEFSAKTSKNTVAADEAFKVQYSVNVEASFTTPELKDFKLLSGPAQSSYTNVQIINGQMKNSYSLSWTLILRPKKEGEFVIPAASITSGGKVYKSNTIKITVTKATGTGVPDNVPDQNQNNSTVKSSGKNVFCNISVSKNKLYVGEPMLITYKLYTRYTRIQDYDIKLGTQKDVWSHEITPGKQGWPSYEENVNGIRYMVFPIKKELVYPLVAGDLKLEPFDMMVVAQISFFDTQRFDVVSNSPVINVMPTPPNAPSGFNNAVGNFKLEATINKETVDVNDGIDLTLKLSGNGNLRLIKPLDFQFPQDFEVYDPELEDKTAVSANGTSGSKTYKYLIIPRHSGDFVIDPIEFSFFNPESKNYVTLNTPEFKIKVNKSKDEIEAGGIVRGKSDVTILDKDVRFLKKFNKLSIGQNFFTGSYAYYIGIIITPLIFFIVVFAKRRRDYQFNPDKERIKKAGRNAVKQLSKAQHLLASANKNEFYNELLKGIQQYYLDKFNKQTVEFNRSEIEIYLNSKNTSSDTIKQFIDIIDQCEMARYASFMKGNEENLFNAANSAIQKLEGEIS